MATELWKDTVDRELRTMRLELTALREEVGRLRVAEGQRDGSKPPFNSVGPAGW